ncbi:MAG TPA: hypothetical protein VEB21_08135 [Terriglobales bacterium]|nr:hypothetical protein [Terriglobales bacterium]
MTHYNEALAVSLIDKRVLIGITYVDEIGHPLERQQFCGIIIRVDRAAGVTVRLDGTGREVQLPPKLRSFRPAPPGEYELSSTGQVVTNPDLLSTWTLRRLRAH